MNNSLPTMQRIERRCGFLLFSASRTREVVGGAWKPVGGSPAFTSATSGENSALIAKQSLLHDVIGLDADDTSARLDPLGGAV